MPRSVEEIKRELAEAEAAARQPAQNAGRTVLNVALDLGDAAQVALAKAAGLLHLPEESSGAGESGSESGSGEGEGETPNRPGYFGN